MHSQSQTVAARTRRDESLSTWRYLHLPSQSSPVAPLNRIITLRQRFPASSSNRCCYLPEYTSILLPHVRSSPPPWQPPTDFVNLIYRLFNFILLLYSIIESVEINQFRQALESENLKGISSIPLMVLLYISHGVLALSEVAYVALAWQVWREFGWKVYKFLGADIAVKRMFAHYQIFLCLVKFDLFFWVGFSVQLIYLVLSTNDMEYYLTILALPLSLLLLIEGHMAARYENKWLMGSFMLGCLAACIYFVYKLFRIWAQANNDFQEVYKSLTVFGMPTVHVLRDLF